MMRLVMIRLAIVELNPKANAMTNKVTASASRRYPTRLASSVHLATCCRRCRTGSMSAGSGVGASAILGPWYGWSTEMTLDPA